MAEPLGRILADLGPTAADVHRGLALVARGACPTCGGQVSEERVTEGGRTLALPCLHACALRDGWRPIFDWLPTATWECPVRGLQPFIPDQPRGAYWRRHHHDRGLRKSNRCSCGARITATLVTPVEDERGALQFFLADVPRHRAVAA